MIGTDHMNLIKKEFRKNMPLILAGKDPLMFQQNVSVCDNGKPSMAKVMSVVLRETGISGTRFRGRAQTQELAAARALYFALCDDLCGVTRTEIGNSIDFHSSRVCYGIKRVKAEPELYHRFTVLREKL